MLFGVRGSVEQLHISTNGREQYFFIKTSMTIILYYYMLRMRLTKLFGIKQQQWLKWIITSLLLVDIFHAALYFVQNFSSLLDFDQLFGFVVCMPLVKFRV